MLDQTRAYWQRSTRLFFLALAITVLATAASAQQRAKPVDISPGATISFQVTGSAFRKIDRLVVVSGNRGKEVATRRISARIGRDTRGSRQVQVTAAKDAKAGTYRINGYAGRTLVGTLPRLVKVTSRKVVRRVVAPPRNAPAQPPAADPAPAPAQPAFSYFNAATGNTTFGEAYLMSLLSWVSYFDPSDARSLLQSWGLTLGSNDFFDIDTLYLLGASGSTQGFVAYNDTAIFVAFQGSTTNDFAQDWIDNDLDVAPQPMPVWGPAVVLHHGFAEAAAVSYHRVRSRVEQLLKDRPNRKVWITGHSLGGAVATLTAFRLTHDHGIKIQGVHTFGAPPVGNNSWKSLFDGTISNMNRWNLQNDPIVSLPPPPIFAHVGRNNNLYANGNHVTGDVTYFIYLPSTAMLHDLNVTHMGYWCRMYEEYQEHSGIPADALPSPPAGSTPSCVN